MLFYLIFSSEEDYRSIMSNANTQLSLVAFYGKKNPHPLWQRIGHIQTLIGKIVGDAWQPYSIERIHGTILGLEGLNINGRIINKYYLENEHREVEMDLESVFREVLQTELLPFTIRIGGYREDSRELFTSRGETPFQRTFIVNRENVVAMGWPYRGNEYVTSLDDLRRSFNRFGCLHKYHTRHCPFENDFYFVLGNLKAPLDEKRKDILRSRALAAFAKWNDTGIELRKEDICLVRFTDTRLLKADSMEISEALHRMMELKAGYPALPFN